MESLKAGHVLDALVAEKILGEPEPTYVYEDGLNLYLTGHAAKSEGGHWVLLFDYEKGDVPEWTPLPFSQDISASWQVVEHLRKRGFEFAFDSRGGNPYWAEFANEDYTIGSQATAETPALAICLAALKVSEA